MTDQPNGPGPESPAGGTGGPGQPGHGQTPPPPPPPPGYGYQQPGQAQPGHGQAGHGGPGYGQAGYGQGGYRQGGYAQYLPGAQKSKIVAGILGILLGGFGVHRFYLGYTGIGIAQIAVTFLTCGVGAIWGLIEGILILVGSSITTDAKGVPLSDT